MKVGDYVRTKDGRIYKIGDIGNFIYSEDDVIIQGIIKSSPNIIDLIEVGDYVNGHKVYGTDDEPKRVYVDSYVEYDNWVSLENANIKSIVTKEQFESMEYKI